MPRNVPELELSRLLDPRGIAVVGASDQVQRIGGQPIRALREFGYRGAIYPVNPRYSHIQGLPCFADLAALPGPCDVALICVAGNLVPQLIRDCASAGIGFAVVLSAGFREVGEAGAPLQRELDEAVRDSGVRVIGPNCQGVMSTVYANYCGFGAPFMYAHTLRGRLAMVTQSGGFGYAVMGLAEAEGLGFNHVISSGNESDVDSLDLIEALLGRSDTDMVAVYLEGVADGGRLRRLGARALDAGKPVLVWKVGNSEAGRRAAASHTANLTADYAMYRAAFAEGGMLEIDDVADLVDVARAFDAARTPAGNRVGVVSISGGAGVLAADRCEKAGLCLPQLAAATSDRLRQLLPTFSSTANPIDVTAQVFNDAAAFEQVVRVVLDDPEVDLLMVLAASVEGTLAEGLAGSLVAVAAEHAKPMYVCASAPRERSAAARRVLAEHRIPVFPTPGRLVRGVAAVWEFERRRRRARSIAPDAVTMAPHPLDLPDCESSLSEHDSKAVLAAYGIESVDERLLAPSEFDALRESPLGYPLVAKIDSPDLPHKTEVGAVRVGLSDWRQVREAVAAMREAVSQRCPQARIHGISLQRMASGTEVIVGATRNRYFGPAVIVGLGGVFTEILQDVAIRFAPFDRRVARDMIEDLQAASVLKGARGREPADLDALAELVSRLSRLIADHGDRISEIDLNPVFVGAQGRGVVVADALVLLQPTEDAR